jgi:hypothetical protein
LGYGLSEVGLSCIGNTVDLNMLFSGSGGIVLWVNRCRKLLRGESCRRCDILMKACMVLTLCISSSDASAVFSDLH